MAFQTNIVYWAATDAGNGDIGLVTSLAAEIMLGNSICLSSDKDQE
jgi:hypothetical protein